jgi:hypothetical protein
MEWKQEPDGSLTAYDGLCIIWRIEKRRFGRYLLRIEGDHTPEWIVGSLDEAFAKAEAISTPPGVPPGAVLFGWPSANIKGDQTRPLDPQPDPPARLVPCPECGFRKPPIAFKPIKFTSDWWDSACMYWKCPRCEHYDDDLEP